MKNNAVYTYYQPIGRPAELELIELWKENWTRQGWDPVILSVKDARLHHDFEWFDDLVRKLPSVNNPEYEVACYHRHLAMAALGGGLLVDYDVMNRAFKPAALNSFRGNGLTILEPTRVPCAVHGDQEDYEILADVLAEYVVQPEDRYNGKPHTSDMEIIRKTSFHTTRHCVEYGCSGEPRRDQLGNGWMKSALIHFSSFSIKRMGHQGAKIDAIKSVLNEQEAVCS